MYKKGRNPLWKSAPALKHYLLILLNTASHLHPCCRCHDRQQCIRIIFTIPCDDIIHAAVFPCHILHAVFKILPFLSKCILNILLCHRKNGHQPEYIFHDNICPTYIACFFSNDIENICHRRCRYICTGSSLLYLPEQFHGNIATAAFQNHVKDHIGVN